MVNTFLVDSNYYKSAGVLDYRRLGKQRVEAYQILLILEDLIITALALDLPFPKNILELADWIRFVARSYHQGNFIFFRTGDFSIHWSSQTKPEIVGNLQLLTQAKNTSCSSAEWRQIKLTFPIYHPATRMWFYWTESLKEYINAHILVWVQRGYQNTMKIYHVAENTPQPFWTTYSQLHDNHRAALLTKEQQRDEDPWYQLQPEFLQVTAFTGYLWPM